MLNRVRHLTFYSQESPMKFGHFDDANREYVIETPRTLIHGLTILVPRDFSRSFLTLPEVTAFIKTHAFAVLHVTATTMCQSIWADVIFTSMTTALSGIRAGLL